VTLARACGPDGAPWCDLGKPARRRGDSSTSVEWENGLFAPMSSRRSRRSPVEFITPERSPLPPSWSSKGRPTGRDVVAALERATRADVPRRNPARRALSICARSRSTHKPGGQLDMLGPRGSPSSCGNRPVGCCAQRPGPRTVPAGRAAAEARPRPGERRAKPYSVVGSRFSRRPARACNRGSLVVVPGTAVIPRRRRARGWVTAADPVRHVDQRGPGDGRAGTASGPVAPPSRELRG